MVRREDARTSDSRPDAPARSNEDPAARTPAAAHSPCEWTGQPALGIRDSGPGFKRFVELLTRLRKQGVLDVARQSTGEYEVLLHDLNEPQALEATDLLTTVGLTRAVTPASDVRIPLRFFVGSPAVEAIEIETATAFDVLRAASRGVEGPQSHLIEGIASPSASSRDGWEPLVAHAPPLPAEHAYVTVGYRNHWYSIDDRDTASKQLLILLRTLIGLRLDTESEGQRTPVLAVPVGR